jgi:hypothetical protein
MIQTACRAPKIEFISFRCFTGRSALQGPWFEAVVYKCGTHAWIKMLAVAGCDWMGITCMKVLDRARLISEISRFSHVIPQEDDLSQKIPV